MPRLKTVSRTALDTPDGGVQAVQQVSKEVSGSVQGASGSVQGVSGDVQSVPIRRTKKDAHVRSWMESFPEIEKIEHNRPQKRILMAIAAATSVLFVLSGQPARLCVFAAILTAATMVGFDLGHATARILADHSRRVVTASVLAWAGFALRPMPLTLASAAAVTVISAALVWACNARWMSAQVYRRTPIVKRMLAKNLPVDLDKLRPTAWRMCTTLAWEQGGKVLDKLTEGEQQLIIGSWMMGYSVGIDMQQHTVEANQRLASENETLMAAVQELTEKAEAAQEYIDDYERYVSDQEELAKELADARELAAERRKMERAAAAKAADYEAKLARRIEELDKANASLSSARASAAAMAKKLEAAEAELEGYRAQAALADDQAAESKISIIAELAETPGERQDRLLRDAAAQGMSVRKAAEYAGCSKSKADIFMRQLRQAASGEELKAAQA